MSKRSIRKTRGTISGVAILDALGDAILADHERHVAADDYKPAPLYVSMMKATAEAKGRR